MPTDIQTLRGLCMDNAGNAKAKTECRAALINHLILEEMLDIDEAEERTEATLNELALWPEEENSYPPSAVDES